MIPHTSVLVLTQDAELRHRCQALTAAYWMPAFGQSLQDIHRWKQQGRQIVIIDTALSRLPRWDMSEWPILLAGLKVLVLSARPNDEEGRKILLAGAVGYAHAATPTQMLERILHSVAAGNIWLGSSLLHALLKDVGQRLPKVQEGWGGGLTSREKEVAELVATGAGNFEIAARLGITERTVRAHLSVVFEKLQVHDRLKLALKVHGIEIRGETVGTNSAKAGLTSL